MDQPLDVLMKMHVVNMTYDTKIFMISKNSDWSRLTSTQRELAKWLDTGE